MLQHPDLPLPSRRSPSWCPYAKSGSLSPLKHFAYDLREIVRRQPLPGYRLTIEQCVGGPEILSFKPIDPNALGIPRQRRALLNQKGGVGKTTSFAS